MKPACCAMGMLLLLPGCAPVGRWFVEPVARSVFQVIEYPEYLQGEARRRAQPPPEPLIDPYQQPAK